MANQRKRSFLRGAVSSQLGAWLFLCLLAGMGGLTGCGASSRGLAVSVVSLSPSTGSLNVGEQIGFNATGVTDASACAWSSSAPVVLAGTGPGVFQGQSAGSATVSAQCGGVTASATVVVASHQASGPITITHGGTYTGTWSSEDWHTPAVRIQTTDPVILRNSTITGRGDLISIPSTGTGANVTVENVTGTALDPMAAGVQRGNFVVAEGVASLIVKHCTISGARFGVKVLASPAASLQIAENVATDLEDRTSDGSGGFLNDRPDLGHFVMLNGVVAPHGAEIAWNQVTNTVGQSSTEDVFNLYKSQGSPGAPISVHDNYMEGNSSPAVAQYTGSGLIADGDAAQPETAFVNFVRNQVVHTAGSGVEIAAGHDILVSDNRVVSCGVNGNGDWIAAPFVNAIVVWNYYGVSQFSNIVVQGTVGGMLRPDGNGLPMVADIWVRTQDLDATDVMRAQAFTDPCLTGSQPNSAAEDAERAFWQAKLSKNNIKTGN